MAATRDFSKYFLYRWRYVIGYTLIGILLAGLLVYAGVYLPGALSQSEVKSVVEAASLNITDPKTWAVANLPYYALQAGVFSLFGVTTFTIKLPSLILAFASALGLILLLRRWFRPNIAVLASFIAVSTSQFLFIAQLGTPSILYIFWPIALLVLATQITRGKKRRFLWKVLFGITAALSLYTPLSIYTLIAITLAAVIHPHPRAIIRRLSKIKLAVVGASGLIVLVPLIYSLVVKPGLGLNLLGIPREWPNLGENLMTLLKQYVLFWEPSANTVMTPVFGLGSAVLIVLGIYRLIRTHETTRSYLIVTWMICLIPILIINPVFTSITYLPLILMLASGLTSLISYWYRLFPRNPYARIAGLVPIVLLVSALIGTGLTRYAYSYHYNANVAPLFSRDVALLPKETTELVVTQSEKPFYDALSKYRTDLTITDTPVADTVTATRSAAETIEGYDVTRIITSQRYREADRFYMLERIDTK